MCEDCRKIAARVKQCERFVEGAPDALTRARLAEMLQALRADELKQRAMCDDLALE